MNDGIPNGGHWQKILFLANQGVATLLLLLLCYGAYLGFPVWIDKENKADAEAQAVFKETLADQRTDWKELISQQRMDFIKALNDTTERFTKSIDNLTDRLAAAEKR